MSTFKVVFSHLLRDSYICIVHCLFTQPIQLFLFRINRREVLCKNGFLEKFAKFTGKHLCLSLFFNKVAGAACNFIKEETQAQVFSCEFCEISKSTSFTEHLRATDSVFYCSSLFFQAFFGPIRETSSEISPFSCYKVVVKAVFSRSRSSTSSPWIVTLAPRTSSSS